MASLWVLCCYSFYSNAYEQQYYVGDTGPNGGTVTSVILDSVLSDTTVEMVGDFEDTTYTYVYTETVVEDIQKTNQITTTTYETVEQTTGDIINNTNLANGSVTCTTQGTGVYYDSNGCGYHVQTWDDGHISNDGGFQFQTDLDNYLTEDEIQYGFDVTASNNVYTSSTTSNWSITIKVIDPTTGNDTQTSYSWLLNQGWNNNLSVTLEVPENNYGSDSVLYSTFYGTDVNGVNWTITPTNFYTSIDYFELTQVISTIEQIITNQIETSLTTTEYETDSVYIPPVIVDVYEPVIETVADFTIEVSTEFDSFEMNFEVMESDTGDMQIEISSMDESGDMEIEIIEVEMEEIAEPVEVEVEESQEEPEAQEEQEEDSEQEQDTKKETNSKSTKEKVAQVIMAKVMETADSIAINNTKLAVMASLSDTEGFAKYQAKQLQDAELYISEIMYDSKQLDDPYAKPYSLAQDYIMEQIVNSQYGRN